jgi:hypothetical protein
LSHPRLFALAIAAACTALLGIGSPALAATEPDLSVKVSGPISVGVNSPFTEKATITNQGTASASGITVSYSAGTAISPGSAPAGMYCTYVTYGHSGRGGGVTVVGDSCSETLKEGLAPGQSVAVRLAMTEGRPENLSLSWNAAPYPAASQLNLVSHTAAAPLSVIRPPAAVAPTGLSVSQTGAALKVKWTPAPATAAYISASLIQASVGGSLALSTVVPGTATSGELCCLSGSTTYSITVANNDGGGAGALSQPALFTTAPATIVPGVPTITYAYGYADIRWSPPASSGNSVIDQYEVQAVGGGQTLTSYVSGTTLSDYLAPTPADSLAVAVRAHNAAGWGPWSVPAYFSDGGGD